MDYVIFALAPDSEYKGIDADEMKKLADAASLALVNALNPTPGRIGAGSWGQPDQILDYRS